MFLVWRKGLRGPVASLDAFDPRNSLEWKLHEQTTIEIIPIDGTVTLDQAVAAHPCPTVVD